jgi:NitT/TauT family transport system ATP-binding protein
MYLSVNNISKTWLQENGTKQALQNLTFEVKKNEFVCIVGSTGCGKTTLLKIIAGIDQATNGQVLLNGKEINKTCSCRSMVFQDPTLFPWKTVYQNIESGLIFKKIDKQKRKLIVEKTLKKTYLTEYQHLYPYQLSGGMKQKTQLARAIAMDSDIVLLDEPFAAMDEILKHQFDNYLLHLWEKEKKTFILVTHSIEEALILADRIIVMKPNPGEIQAEYKIDLARPRDLFSDEIVQLRKKIRHEISKFY